MFCPKCATQNVDGAKFCRSCGADISLVPQAMTGNIQPAYQPGEGMEAHFGRRRGKRPSIEKGIKSGFMGVGFLLVAIILAYAHDGRGWWYWMLIPAFSMLGGGVAEYVRAKSAEKALPLQPAQAGAIRSTYGNELPPRSTNELMPPPPSVTEGTTRHLGQEGPTKVFTPVERPTQEG
jgi:hypothetical protein